MQISKRWSFGSVIVLVILIMAVVLYARQPLTNSTDSSSTAEKAAEDANNNGAENGSDTVEASISISAAEIDQVFQDALAALDRIAAGEEQAEPDGEMSDATEAAGMASQEEADEDVGAMDFEMAEEDAAADAPKPESVVDEFVSALRNLDLDTMLSMARGQAREKISELRNEAPPPEAMAMFQMIEATNGRQISDDEFRFNLSIPMENDSPEIVMRRDGGRWWIDEIVE